MAASVKAVGRWQGWVWLAVAIVSPALLIGARVDLLPPIQQVVGALAFMTIGLALWIGQARRGWRTCGACGLLVLAALAGVSLTAPSAGSANTRELDAYLEEQVDRSPLPGLAVAVTHGEEVVHVAGYGTAGDGRAMTARTPVRIASLSKAFTAVAVLQQVEDGPLDLDAPVRRYLPEFDLADESAAEAITVRQLLNQTSGLADRDFPGLWQLDERRPAERVASLSDARPSAEPGTTFSYFNPNYEVLARLVEVASGEEFDNYVQSHVFTPLGMADTVSVTRAEHAASAAPRLAQGHIVVFGAPLTRAEPDGYVAGSSGVVSTADDLAQWLVAHTNAGTVDGRRILDADHIELTHTAPPGIDSPYGMGWMAATSGDDVTLEHTGVLATVYAEQVLLPDTGHGIVLLANANHAFNDVPRIKDGLVEFLTGGSAASPQVTHERLAALIAALLIAGLALRVHGINHRHRWAQQRLHGSVWRRWFGVVRLLAPALLLASLPTLIALAGGRVFPMRLLALATPELVAWLTIASITGLALAAARIVALRDAQQQQ